MSVIPQSIACKESGVQWLGKIPTHWKIKKIKYIFDETSIKNCGDKQQLASTQQYGVIPKALYPFRTVEVVSSDLNAFKFVEKNNFVISLRSFEGGIEHSEYEGIISPAYTILKVKKSIEPLYFKFLLKSRPFISALQLYKTGIREGQNISYAELQQDFLPTPPLEEQKKIADFLDKKTRQIEEFITKKQKLITLLEEKKQTLINQCVTQGLDPSTPLKDSGVEWLGKIPTHWEVRKLKYVVSLRNQKEGESDFRIGLENIESKTGRFIQADESAFDDEGIGFFEGDVLFGKLRPYLAKVFLADKNGICVSEFLVLKSEGILNRFLKFLMLSGVFIEVVNSSTYGTKMPRANWEFIGNLKIPIPPLEEQKAIAEYLDTQIEKIDLAICKIKSQINLIKEYKTTLISEAVCGRVGIN